MFDREKSQIFGHVASPTARPCSIIRDHSAWRQRISEWACRGPATREGASHTRAVAGRSPQAGIGFLRSMPSDDLVDDRRFLERIHHTRPVSAGGTRAICPACGHLRTLSLSKRPKLKRQYVLLWPSVRFLWFAAAISPQ